MNFLLQVLLVLGFSAHNIQIAHFEIYKQKENLVIGFVFDLDDFLSTQEALDIELTDEVIQKYIDENFSLVVNNIPQNITFGKTKIKGEHIHLEGQISNMSRPIVTVKIDNTCLLNIENHSNIIKLRLYEKQRDFLMNNDRTSIQIDY